MERIEEPELEGSPPLRVERRGELIILTLHRPARLNAVTLGMYEALAAELAGIRSDRSVRAVVLTGAGRAFCVGADLKAHAAAAAAAPATGASAPGDSAAPTDAVASARSEPASPDRRHYIAAGQRANRMLQRLPQPVVAAVNGHAIGAGLELALSADLIVVAEEAKLRLPEVALGTFVGGGVTYTLPERVGLARAKELVLLGEFFTGRDAVDLGLANRAVAADQVLDQALELARRLARQAPLSVARAKRLLNRGVRSGVPRALALEARALLACMGTEDWREGIRAFQEKREPEYRGR